jgi:ATP/maltotriose-dependent transcriptional regulator MalT
MLEKLPTLPPARHAATDGWSARHGFLVEAVRHAQDARDWDLAARLLCDHLLGLVLDGPGPTSQPVRRIEALPQAALPEPLTGSEARVLRYLAATRLAVPEIARELSVSVNTVRTHMRHIYAKLGAHKRSEAVERARTLGLLARATGRPTRGPEQSHPALTW